MKDIFITEEEYLQIVEDKSREMMGGYLPSNVHVIRQLDLSFDEYHHWLAHQDDEYYTKVSKEESGLPADILFAEMLCCEGIHPLWVKIVGKKNEFGYYDMFPMTVERNPRLLGSLSRLPISIDELGQIWQFVRKHIREIRMLADQDLRFDEFCKLCFPVAPVGDGIPPRAMGLYVVRDSKTNKLNFMKENGTLLSCQVWFDAIHNFHECQDGIYCADVFADENRMRMDKDGNFIDV